MIDLRFRRILYVFPLKINHADAISNSKSHSLCQRFCGHTPSISVYTARLLHAHVLPDGSRTFMMVKLLSGEEVDLPSNSGLKIPPDKPAPAKGRFDTVTGTTKGSKVYIVYENGRAYPEYLVTYRT